MTYRFLKSGKELDVGLELFSGLLERLVVWELKKKKRKVIDSNSLVHSTFKRGLAFSVCQKEHEINTFQKDQH